MSLDLCIDAGADADRSELSRSVAGRHRRIILVLATALVVRLALVWGTTGLELKIEDEQHYHQLARSLARGDGFAWSPGHPTSLRPPLYPAFIAAVWWLTGTQSLESIRVAQVVLSLLIVLLVYRLTSLAYDARAGAVAALVVALYPSFLFAGVLLLTEILFTFFLVLSGYCYALLMRNGHAAAAFATGTAVGLAALTRSVLWPFPLVLVPLALFTVRRSMWGRGLCASALLLGYLVVVGPWAIRNTRLQGTFTVVDTMGGLNLHMGNYAHTPEDRMWAAISQQGEKHWAYALEHENTDRTGWTEGTKEQWARATALAYMRQHPEVTLRRSILKFADFWGLERELLAGLQHAAYGPPRWAVPLLVVAVTVCYPALLVLAVFGACVKPPSDSRVHGFLLLAILFIAGIHSIVFGHSRYHLPLIPLLAVYVGRLATARAWREPTFRDWRRAALPLALTCVFVAIWLREVFVRDAERVSRLLGALW